MGLGTWIVLILFGWPFWLTWKIWVSFVEYLENKADERDFEKRQNTIKEERIRRDSLNKF